MLIALQHHSKRLGWDINFAKTSAGAWRGGGWDHGETQLDCMKREL